MQKRYSKPTGFDFGQRWKLGASTKQGTAFKIKVESDLVSMKGVVVDRNGIECGLL